MYIYFIYTHNAYKCTYVIYIHTHLVIIIIERNFIKETKLSTLFNIFIMYRFANLSHRPLSPCFFYIPVYDLIGYDTQLHTSTSRDHKIKMNNTIQFVFVCI